MWVEICSDSIEDWQEALEMFAESFKNSDPFISPGRTVEERRKFIHEYFKYIYEIELSNGRGGLACVKELNEDGSTSIVYAACVLFKIQPFHIGDISGMEAIDPEVAARAMEDDKWLHDEVHSRIVHASKDLDISLIHGHLLGCRRDRMHSGLGLQYSRLLINMLYQDAVRRGYFDNAKPCISYAVTDTLSSFTFHEKLDYTNIVHLHPGTPSCRERDPSLGKDANCVHVFATALNGELDIKTLLPQYFNQSANISKL